MLANETGPPEEESITDPFIIPFSNKLPAEIGSDSPIDIITVKSSPLYFIYILKIK
jgi:hypothetical protein